MKPQIAPADMPDQTRELTLGPRARTLRTRDGKLLEVPADWALLEPGDAALTRRVKQAGPSWAVSERKGRRVFSRGVWVPAERIARLRGELELERADPAYGKQLAAGRARREREQVAYEAEFKGALLAFLDFDARHADLAGRLADAIAAHAVPVGSGTVARTRRIGVAERAEAATIAWLRHNTTGYDDMRIARVRGERRAVRRMLAERSRALLADYRRGDVPEDDPLARALGE